MRRAMVLVLTLSSLCATAEAGRRPRPRRDPATSGARARPAHADPAAVERLGRAVAAYRQGDFEAARALAAPLVEAGLANRDLALYVAAQSSFFAGDRAAALPLFRALAGTAGSRLRGIAAWRVADCLWALDRFAEARDAYEDLLSGDEPDGDRAVALFRIAEARRRAGERRRALEGWRRVALEHPGHPLGRLAVERLEAAGHALGPRDRIRRASVLSRARGWTQALDELALVGDDPPEELRILRDYWTGETLFWMRRQYERAGELLIGVHDKVGGQGAEALFHGARALSRAHRDPDAIRWYGEVVRKYPKSEFAAEAQYLSGWLEFNAGDFAAAIPGLEALLARYPSCKWTDDALWHLGFSHYLLGHHEQALRVLERLARRGGALEGGKGRYWKARTLEAMGRADEAAVELRGLVTRFPFSWYALLARARLKERGVTIGPFGDRAPAARPPGGLGAIEAEVAADPALARADELLAAGLRVEAGAELRRIEGVLLDRYGGARALPVLLDRYRRADDYNRPWQLATVRGGRALDAPPVGGARTWWEHAFPLAYREHVERYGDLGKSPPYYLYAIMLKESGFNPHDVSYADAIGLMQMIPPTTRRVAPQVGLTYTEDLLFDPELNVKVGAWYIGRLFHKFKEQVPIGAGSFNSGPRPVMRWLDAFGDRPIDEFVERVTFAQTREYMKKVTGIYARYLYLYAGVEYEQPLAVDRTYVKDEVTY